VDRATAKAALSTGGFELVTERPVSRKSKG